MEAQRKKLESGRFLGETVNELRLSDLFLADVRYPESGNLPLHVHARPYFCLIQGGTYTEGYDRKTRRCIPGMLVFHPAGETHSETFDESRVASFNVEIGPEWTQRMNEFGILLDRPVEFDRGDVVALAVRMLEELSATDSESALSMEALTWEILAAFGHASPSVEHSEPQWLRDAREVLDSRFEESLSLRSVARDVGVHPVHFAAAFRRFQGCSPGQYLRRRRFERARHLILDPDASLAEVATDAGFCDQSHLNRVFRRFTGMTPGQYRTFLSSKTSTESSSRLTAVGNRATGE
jgi:AraC family transcriptional regulator